MNERYPIIITKDSIYNVIDHHINKLGVNNIQSNIFDENLRYIASYYPKEKSIKNFIPIFSYFHEFHSKINPEIYSAFYDNYSINYNIENDSFLQKSESFEIYDPNIIDNIHYYITYFTIYQFDENTYKEEED